MAAALKQIVRTQNPGVVMAGEVGVFTKRNPDTVRAPDVLFLSHERDALRRRPQGFLDVAPELTVEILPRRIGRTGCGASSTSTSRPACVWCG